MLRITIPRPLRIFHHAITIGNYSLISDPINLLISTLNKTEFKLDEIEMRLIHNQTICAIDTTIKVTYVILEELLLHLRTNKC